MRKEGLSDSWPGRLIASEKGEDFGSEEVVVVVVVLVLGRIM